jgi:hypothetical protein
MALTYLLVAGNTTTSRPHVIAVCNRKLRKITLPNAGIMLQALDGSARQLYTKAITVKLRRMSGNDCWAREQGCTWRYMARQYLIRSLPAEVLVVCLR